MMTTDAEKAARETEIREAERIVLAYANPESAHEAHAAILALLDNAPAPAGVKRHEWKLPAANWLRNEINQTLSRYDVHSDAYERDTLIDALCVIAVDKILVDLASPAEVTVQEAAKVLLDQPYHVMAKAFDAMEAKQGEGSDRIMSAALRVLSGDRT